MAGRTSRTSRSMRLIWIAAPSSRLRSTPAIRAIPRPPATLEAAATKLAAVDAAPAVEDPVELIADKGYHSRDSLKDLDDGPWTSRIAEKKVQGVNRWRGDQAARRAVYNNRARLRSGAAKEAFRLRAELVERSFASPSIVAACVAPGCAGARTCTSATSCTSPATISA